MREIRTFELEHDDPASAWRAAHPLDVRVTAGELWLTVEGDADDHWLAAGQTFRLRRGAVAWMSAGREGARLSLTATGREAQAVRVQRQRAPTFGWMPRWLFAS